MTSFHLPRGEVAVLNALVKRFPNVVLIDVAQALAQVQRMMDQVGAGGAVRVPVYARRGLAVLYAAIASTQDERLYQATIMRTLGASRAQINRAHLAEFTSIGAAAGFVAACGRDRARLVPGEALPASRLCAGSGGVADRHRWAARSASRSPGYIGTRRVLDVAPLKVLRSVGRTYFMYRHVCDGGEVGCRSRRRARSNMSILRGLPTKRCAQIARPLRGCGQDGRLLRYPPRPYRHMAFVGRLAYGPSWPQRITRLCMR